MRSTSGSDVWLVAEPRADLAAPDWTWLAAWLAESLGVPIQIILCREPDAISVPELQPVIYYGGEDFRRRVRRRPSGADPLAIHASQSDWLARVCQWLRRDQPWDNAREGAQATLDRSIVTIGRALDQDFPGLSRVPYWPSPHRCAVVLTHDVDAVDRWSAAHVWHLARHVPERFATEGLRAVLRLPWAAARGLRDSPPLAQVLEQCIALERAHGIRATFLFFAPLAAHRTAFDGWYTAETRMNSGETIRSLWDRLTAAGFEVGLHVSIGAHADRDAIAAEWRSLQALVPKLTTYRSHYLKQVPGVTAAALASAGARVDLNLVSLGFGRGSGLPFRFVDGTAMLYRLPTVIQDAELETGGGSPAVRDAIWTRWRMILDETARNGMLATVLIHPENPGACELIERLLRWGRAHDAWMPSVAQLIDHWQERQAVHGLVGVLDRLP